MRIPLKNHLNRFILVGTLLFSIAGSIFLHSCEKIEDEIDNALSFEGVFESSDGWEVELDGSSAKVTTQGTPRATSTFGVGRYVALNMKRTSDNTWEGTVQNHEFSGNGPGTVSLSSSNMTVSPEGGTPYSFTRISSGSGSGSGSGNGSGNGSGSSLPGYGGNAVTGYWKRNDGQTAYLSLSGSTAKTCANGIETLGTFKNAKPYSITFVIQGNTIKFPLDFSTDGKKMIMGVPDQAINTNNATEYVKSSTFPCSGGNGGGGGGGPVIKGQTLIWTKLKATGYSYNVNIKGPSYNFNSYMTRTDSEPACGASGSNTHELAPGNYTYSVAGKKWHASGTPVDANWGGSFTVTSNNCNKIELK